MTDDERWFAENPRSRFRLRAEGDQITVIAKMSYGYAGRSIKTPSAHVAQSIARHFRSMMLAAALYNFIDATNSLTLTMADIDTVIEQARQANRVAKLERSTAGPSVLQLLQDSTRRGRLAENWEDPLVRSICHGVRHVHLVFSKAIRSAVGDSLWTQPPL